jgi:hypothetical protein
LAGANLAVLLAGAALAVLLAGAALPVLLAGAALAVLLAGADLVPPLAAAAFDADLAVAAFAVLLAVVAFAVLFAGAAFEAFVAVAEAFFAEAAGVAPFVVRWPALVPARLEAAVVTERDAVDRAAGAAADRAVDVVRPALLVAGVLVAAMAYRPLPG